MTNYHWYQATNPHAEDDVYLYLPGSLILHFKYLKKKALVSKNDVYQAQGSGGQAATNPMGGRMEDQPST